MAESTLSIAYNDLLSEVSGFLGYGVDSALLSADKLQEVDRYVQSGIRQFYFPSAIPGDAIGHEWSFLRPVATLSTAVDDGIQDLPDDFGRIIGDLHFAASVQSSPVLVVGEGRLLALLQQSSDSGRPTHAAVRFKASDGAAGQRLELMWSPIPDAVYVMTYRYEAYSGKLSNTKPYPLGGMRHSELITESCLAISEQRANDEKGLHTERFSALLVASVLQDRKMGARYFGHMGSLGESGLERAVRSTSSVTYKGETW